MTHLAPCGAPHTPCMCALVATVRRQTLEDAATAIWADACPTCRDCDHAHSGHTLCRALEYARQRVRQVGSR